MIQALLRSFLESPYRRWIVITATLLTLLVVGGPAADEYFALRDRTNRLNANLETTRKTVGDLTKIEQTFTKKMDGLQKLESQLADERGLNDFRSWVVDQIRQSGCQMRKVRVGSASTRKWRENGSPLEVTPNDGPETNYNLTTLPFSVAASGSSENVRDLLGRLNKSEKMMQAKRFSLHPDGTDGREIVLDLELLLFDLKELENKENKTS